MQGSLSVHSTPGHGSTFTLFLPLAATPNQPALPDLDGQPLLVISEQDALLQPLTRMLNLANGRPLRGTALSMLDSASSSAIALIDADLLSPKTADLTLAPEWQHRTILIGHEDMDSPSCRYLREPVTRTALFKLLAPPPPYQAGLHGTPAFIGFTITSHPRSRGQPGQSLRPAGLAKLAVSS